MPYVLMRTENVSTGPVAVLDGHDDLELIKFLHGNVLENNINPIIHGPPVKLLNKAETKGYKVISTVVQGNTVIWTLHKEAC